MQSKNTSKQLSTNIRILLGVVSLPSLLLGAMVISMAANGQGTDISLFEIVYAFAGGVALYMALTGKRLF